MINTLHAAAHRAVFLGIQSGALAVPEVCEVCGGAASLYHHPDYSRPLYVVPLCVADHVRVHNGSVPEPRTGRVYSRPATPPREEASPGLGQYIRALRIAHGLRLADIGDLLGVTKACVSFWEHGDRLPRPGHLAALLDAYGVDDRTEAYALYFEAPVDAVGGAS